MSAENIIINTFQWPLLKSVLFPISVVTTDGFSEIQFGHSMAKWQICILLDHLGLDSDLGWLLLIYQIVSIWCFKLVFFVVCEIIWFGKSNYKNFWAPNRDISETNPHGSIFDDSYHDLEKKLGVNHTLQHRADNIPTQTKGRKWQDANCTQKGPCLASQTTCFLYSVQRCPSNSHVWSCLRVKTKAGLFPTAPQLL